MRTGGSSRAARLVSKGRERPLGSNLRFSSGIPSRVTLIGAPGFEPGTSATRTQRSTGLSHAPCFSNGRGGIDLAPTRSSRPDYLLGGLERIPPHPIDRQKTDVVGFELTRALTHTISNRAP